MTTSILKDFLAAFNAHDLDRIVGFVAEDCELCMPRGSDPWGARYIGKRAVREGLATRFAGIPARRRLELLDGVPILAVHPS